MATKKKRKEVDRRISGISLSEPSRVGAPRCHLVYEVWWSDGSKTFERGQTLYGACFQIDPHTEKPPKNNRADLYAHITAAAVLVRQLEEECIALDGVKV